MENKIEQIKDQLDYIEDLLEKFITIQGFKVTKDEDYYSIRVARIEKGVEA